MPVPGSADEETDLVLRPADPGDAETLADLFIAAREAAYPAMPRSIHPPEEIHAWFRRLLEGGRETWVAERESDVVGYIVLDPEWLDSIYVRSDLTGEGIGTVLLDLAKSLRPEGFGLWVFVSNEGAQRFYRRHGLVEIRRTDGADNEEREPDIELAWLGTDPVMALRRRIDALDEGLATLLDRRAVLSGIVQELKEVPGHAGRDPRREAEIAARMAEVAPRLGRDRILRIMHVVISESLDAAAES
jgi:chorismate mutase/GNAT superfamily N-acetyltransferase